MIIVCIQDEGQKIKTAKNRDRLPENQP